MAKTLYGQGEMGGCIITIAQLVKAGT